MYLQLRLNKNLLIFTQFTPTVFSLVNYFSVCNVLYSKYLINNVEIFNTSVGGWVVNLVLRKYLIKQTFLITHFFHQMLLTYSFRLVSVHCSYNLLA